MPLIESATPDDLDPSTRDYLRDLADRAVKSAAQGAVASIGVETVHVNALAVDWSLMGGMAAGMAALSLLTNIGERGITGRKG